MEDCELLDLAPVISHKSKDIDIIEEYIDAGYGKILVAQQGVKFKAGSSQCCIVTFHDIALNYLSNFQAFFNYHRMRPVIDRMPVIHINAPGQEDNADDLADDYEYPTMDQLADSVRTVCNYYNIKQMICLGVGLGANVMARVAKLNPDIVDGCFLVNPVPTTAGWSEWLYQKKNMYHLRGVVAIRPNRVGYENFDDYMTGFPQNIIEYLIWHHFGVPSEERSNDLMDMYKNYFSCCKIRPKNLAMLIDSYLRRTDIGVQRGSNSEIQCSTLVICGNDSPFLEDSVNMNQRLNPERSTWMKLYDCGMVLDERPDKASEAFILFVQGLGLGLLTCYKYK